MAANSPAWTARWPTSAVSLLTRISHLDPPNTPEGHGNVGETADSRFHPSRPSGLGHLIWRKALAPQRKLMHEAARTAIHLGNPGLGTVFRTG
jgi:hypothetical protein